MHRSNRLNLLKADADKSHTGGNLRPTTGAQDFHDDVLSG